MDSLVFACSVPCFDIKKCPLDYLTTLRLSDDSHARVLRGDVGAESLQWLELAGLRTFFHTPANEIVFGKEPDRWNMRGSTLSSASDGFSVDSLPLTEAELLKVLSKHDAQVERSFRDTYMGGGSGLSSLSVQ